VTRLTEAQLRELPHEILSDTGHVDMRRIDGPLTEREEQAAVIAWADMHSVANVLYANVNGQYRQGQRPEPGLRPGVPDLFLPVARDGWHGLYIEMKRVKGGVLSKEQRRWIEVLRNNGYQAVVCRGAEDAIAQIEAYLEADK